MLHINKVNLMIEDKPIHGQDQNLKIIAILNHLIMQEVLQEDLKSI